MRIMFALLFAAAAILPMTVQSEAKKAPKNKMCVATALNNTKVSFKCKAAEKCCFDSFTSKGTCVAASASCL